MSVCHDLSKRTSGGLQNTLEKEKVCVCVRQRERGREREKKRGKRGGKIEKKEKGKKREERVVMVCERAHQRSPTVGEKERERERQTDRNILI